MNTMNRFFNILFVAVVLILMGCENNETLSLKGDIVGFVEIIDEYGNEIEDKSGVEVEFENTSYSATTNKIGKYEIKDVPAGTYSITYTSDSCGMDKYTSFQHVGGNVAAYVSELTLYKFPTYKPDTIEVFYSNGYVDIVAYFTYPSKDYYAKIYFSNSAEVSNEDYSYYSTISITNESTVGTNTSFNIENTDMSILSPIYYVVYQFNYYGRYAGYYDYEAGEQVYTCYRKVSDVKELVID